MMTHADPLLATLSVNEIEARDTAQLFTDSNRMYERVPALFTLNPHPKMSDRYSFTNTYDIVLALHNRGFKVSSVMGGQHKYSKVMIRMRNTNYDVRDNTPELVLLDSHDGSSRLKLFLGVVRLICMNGCIAGDTLYSKSFMHVAPDLMAQVMLELLDIDEHTKRLNNRVDIMKNYATTIGDRIALADAAIQARFGKDRRADFVVHMRRLLLNTRRDEDSSNDMYTVMNVIQENVLRGGMNYLSNHRVQRMAPINDVGRNTSINQILWTSAEALVKQAA